jgi:hypothetical protein
MLSILLFFGSYISGLIAAFRYAPIFAFITYQAVYFYNPEKRWWGNSIPELSYSYYTVICMLVLLLLNWKKVNNSIWKIPQLKLVWFLMLLYGVTYFWSPIQSLHYASWVFYLKMVVTISVAFKLCNTEKTLNYILLGYVYGAWYISFYVFQVGRNNGGRVEKVGTIDSPDANGLAAAIAPSIAICLYYFWASSNKKLKFLMVITGAFITNALVLINSRGAMLSVLAGVGFFMTHMFFSRVKKKNQRMAALGIVLVGISGVVYLADDTFIERMYTLKTESSVTTERETGATRMVFWGAAWDMAKDYPLGKGYRGFNQFGASYVPEHIDTGKSRNRTVHSTWFEALSETGYIGLLLLILIVYYCFKTTQLCKHKLRANSQLKEYYKVVAIQSALISFLVAMTFLNRMRAEILHWCILFTAVAYQIYVLKNEEKDIEPI